jgi:hypothetical protein
MMAQPCLEIQQERSPTSMQLYISIIQIHARYAQMCLEKLSEPEYQSPERLARYFHGNGNPGCDGATQNSTGNVSYEYAAMYWSVHLAAIPEPKQEILHLVEDFFKSNALVTWAERVGIELVLQVRALLRSLPLELQNQIHLENFLADSYLNLYSSYKKAGNDKVLPYLCLGHLGTFYNMLGETKAAKNINKRAAHGLSELLGEDNPLTMRAKVKMTEVCLEINKQRRPDGLRLILGARSQEHRYQGIQLNDLENARSNLEQAYERASIWGSKVLSIDTAIQLIILHHESNRPKLAQEYINSLSKPGIADQYFERWCQVRHLQALLYIDHGEYDSAIEISKYLLSDAGTRNNRSLLWVRLTLATVLRYVGRHDEASKLFRGIIINGGDILESDSLKIALLNKHYD